MDCDSHKNAVFHWFAAKQATVAGSVVSQLSEQHRKDILRNREAVSTLVRSVLFCSRQCIGLKGHNESAKINAAVEQKQMWSSHQLTMLPKCPTTKMLRIHLLSQLA